MALTEDDKKKRHGHLEWALGNNDLNIMKAVVGLSQPVKQESCFQHSAIPWGQ